MDVIQTIDRYIEAVDRAAEQKHAIKNGGGEGVNMLRTIHPRGGSTQGALKIGNRCTSLRRALQQKIGRDRKQMQARNAPAQFACNGSNQPQSKPSTALRAIGPSLGHANTICPLTSVLPSRVTRN